MILLIGVSIIVLLIIDFYLGIKVGNYLEKRHNGGIAWHFVGYMGTGITLALLELQIAVWIF